LDVPRLAVYRPLLNLSEVTLSTMIAGLSRAPFYESTHDGDPDRAPLNRSRFARVPVASSSSSLLPPSDPAKIRTRCGNPAPTAANSQVHAAGAVIVHN